MSNIYKHRKPHKIGESGGMRQVAQPEIEGFESIFKSFLQTGRRSLSLAQGAHSGDFQAEDLAQNDWPLQLVEQVKDRAVSAIRIPLEGAVERQVVAIDTSSIIVAAGRSGVAVGVRGSVAVRNELGLEVQRIGPFIAYLTHENLPEILGSILGEFTPLEFSDYRLDGSIQKILAGLLEKRIQEYVVRRFRDSIILLDGSLSAGPLDNPLWLVSRILDEAKPGGNDVLAFSKTSILQFWASVFTEDRLGVEPPYLVDMTWLIEEIEMKVKVLGRTYLARLGSGLNIFRVDASTSRRIEEVFGSLLRSDPLIYGYPEILILAHDYCTFTRSDVIAIQSILRRFGAEFFKASSIRDILFNPLDGEWKR
ncbi:MAG: hypothetical protein DRN54_03070 [Thaumarchaeota archaeon]|nr:MAG: hypothetical protein DRN54_03070 [Nitrososphaerota archaeon]